ncbi:hypothetical protein ACTFIY_010601 [Dictyostelium cf. discoideum]
MYKKEISAQPHYIKELEKLNKETNSINSLKIRIASKTRFLYNLFTIEDILKVQKLIETLLGLLINSHNLILGCVALDIRFLLKYCNGLGVGQSDLILIFEKLYRLKNPDYKLLQKKQTIKFLFLNMDRYLKN